jgi:hypothetical protein
MVMEQVIGPLPAQPTPAYSPAMNAEMDHFVPEVPTDAADHQEPTYLPTASHESKYPEQGSGDRQTAIDRHGDFRLIAWFPMMTEMQTLNGAPEHHLLQAGM